MANYTEELKYDLLTVRTNKDNGNVQVTCSDVQAWHRLNGGSRHLSAPTYGLRGKLEDVVLKDGNSTSIENMVVDGKRSKPKPPGTNVVKTSPKAGRGRPKRFFDDGESVFK